MKHMSYPIAMMDQCPCTMYLGQVLNLMENHGLVGKLDKGLGKSESKRTKTSAET